ncbi:hypothetical protein [Macrococcus sp. DPC7161]|uniref:hypothetical protein n=1 Tax=Macrococcus sp. DPC7161 TaxID=2507060 RepID=UPI00100BBB54|nr:hypothetical protein [Macrococcus sp. DPC7161]RXK18068.1 hypothetical protein ER639_07750 [Macrococcus sp. DPC7161]
MLNRQLEYLNEHIVKEQKFDEILNVFEKMCQDKISGLDKYEDMILFEAGVYNFTGQDLFHVSLTRQVPNEDEFFQLSVTLLFEVDIENEQYQITIWDCDLDNNIFEYIKSTDVFKYANNTRYKNIEIVLDET